MSFDINHPSMALLFNPIRLIDEVKKRSGLYDPEHKSDREEKLSLWKEIGAALYSDWARCNKAEAYDRVLQLQKKWRSIRDAYNRELRARKSGVRINKRTYIYFKRMSFLGGFDGEISDDNQYYEDGQETTLFDSYNEPDKIDENQPECPDDPLVKSTIVKIKQPKKRRVKKHSVHSNPPEELEMSFPDDVQEDVIDSDKLFLLSFLPEMRQLPVNLKMWARVQIANVMQEAVSSHYNNTMPRSERNFDVKRQRRDSSD